MKKIFLKKTLHENKTDKADSEKTSFPRIMLSDRPHTSSYAVVIPLLLLLALLFCGCTEPTYTPSAVSCCTALSVDNAASAANASASANADGELLITVEIASGSGDSGKIYCISASADTIENAFNKMRLVHPGKLNLRTVQSIVLSPSLTERQLENFFEYALGKNAFDSRSLSLGSLLAFSNGCSASEILTGKAAGNSGNESDNKRAVPVGIVLRRLSEDKKSEVCESTLLSALRCVYSYSAPESSRSEPSGSDKTSGADEASVFDPENLVLCAAEPDESSGNPDESIRISGTMTYTKAAYDENV